MDADVACSSLEMNFTVPFKTARSPKLDEDRDMMDLTGVFNLKSPLSILATDMDVNFNIQSSGQFKTPRRCLLQDLAQAQEESQVGAQESPVRSFSQPTKRAFTKTHTAFGRLQANDTNILKRESSNMFLKGVKPPVPPINSKDNMKQMLTSRAGLSHWNARAKISGDPLAKPSLKRFSSDTTTKSKKIAVQVPEKDALYAEQSPILPFIHCQNRLQQINPTTLVKILDGGYSDVIDSYILVDCRYSYEFAGGHIIGAENICIPESLEKRFFSIPCKTKCLVIFHCEYSHQRAPRMALHFRSTDRQMNEYPNLYYPEMYVLEGGYKRFYAEYPDRCDPKGYVPMNASEYKQELKTAGKRAFKKSFSEGFLSRD